jgi:hypothetical protein
LATEVLLFPVAAFGAVQLYVSGRRAIDAVAGRGRVLPADRRGWAMSLVMTAMLAAVAVVVVRGGAVLRDRHRWAATVWRVDGQPRLAMWRAGAHQPGPGRAQSGAGPSPVYGATPGAALITSPARPQADADIVLPDVTLPPAMVHLSARVAWRRGSVPGARVSLSAGATGGPAVADAVFDGVSTVATMGGSFVHGGGPLRPSAHLEQPAASAASTAAVIDRVTVTKAEVAP